VLRGIMLTDLSTLILFHVENNIERK
jgi:hypothetical protein